MLTLTNSLHFTRALRSCPFAWLWAGQAMSTLGNGAYLTALAWQVLLLTHSGTAMALILVATSVPQLIFLLIGGVIADRLPRRLVMLWSDSGRALAVMAIATLGWIGALHVGSNWVFIASGILNFALTCFALCIRGVRDLQ